MYHLLTLVLLTLPLGCSSKTAEPKPSKVPTAETPPSPSALSDAATRAPAPSFERFVIKDFNWEIQGYDVLVLNSDGSGTFVGAVGETRKEKGVEYIAAVWHRIDWQVDPAKLAAFIAKLDELKFSSLEPLYINRDIDDGQNIEFTLVTTGGTNKVTCSNEFPDSIRELRALAKTSFLDKLYADLKKAPKLSQKEAEEFWAQF